MARTFRDRLRSATALEKTVYVVLLLVLAGDVGLIVFARADDDTPPTTSSARPAATTTQDPASGTTASEPATPDATDPPPCAEVEDPAPDADPVTCRTRTTTLVIAGEERPAVLGGTQVRLLEATVRGRTLTARLRVRNETPAEQGVLAGGQEIYLNLNGLRVDPQPVGDLRVPSMAGATTTLRFPLTPGRARVLAQQGSKAELGVRPWTEDVAADPVVGVIRFTASRRA